MSEKRGKILSYNATNRLGEVQPEGTDLRARFYLTVVSNPDPLPKAGDTVTFEAPDPRKSKSGKLVQADASAVTIVERPERAAPLRASQPERFEKGGRNGQRGGSRGKDRNDRRESRVGQAIGGIGREPIRILREEGAGGGDRKGRGDRNDRRGAPRDGAGRGERPARSRDDSQRGAGARSPEGRGAGLRDRNARGSDPRRQGPRRNEGRSPRERQNREPRQQGPRTTPLSLSIFPLPSDFNPEAVHISSVNGSLILEKLTAWPRPKTTEERKGPAVGTPPVAASGEQTVTELSQAVAQPTSDIPSSGTTVQPAALPEAVAAAGSSERFGGLTERNKDFFLKNFFLPAFQSVQQNLPFAAIRARHEELLESFRLRGLTVHSRILRSSARIAQGLTTQTSLGSAGIALDRAFGYPIIPATVLRGALRQYLERQVVRPARRPRRGEIAPATTNETAPADAAKRILDALGSRGVAGQITILDAIPAKLPMVAGVDLSACHHEEWYTNGAPAADSDSPSITRFLSLRPGAEFSFAILAETQEDGADLASLAMDALTRALRTDGVGARSTLGYGRLNPVPVSTGVRKRKNRRGKGRVVISVSPSGKSEGNSDTGQQPAVVNATPAAGGSETGATTTP